MIRDELAEHLARERDAAQAFAQLLEEERTALAAGTADHLPDITGRKNSHLRLLNQLAENRARLLEARQLPAGRSGIETWLVRQPALTGTWHELRACIAKAKTLNALNGRLIDAGLEHTTRALAALIAPATGTGPFYGRDGQPDIAISRRRLGRA